MQISSQHFVFDFETMATRFGLLVEPFGGGKLKKGQPTKIFPSFCPFCGKKFPKAKSTLEPAPAIRAAVEREGL